MSKKRKMAKSVKGKRRTTPIYTPPPRQPVPKARTLTIWFEQKKPDRSFTVRYFLDSKEVEVEEGFERRTYEYHDRACPSNAVRYIQCHFKKEFPDQCPTD